MGWIHHEIRRAGGYPRLHLRRSRTSIWYPREYIRLIQDLSECGITTKLLLKKAISQLDNGNPAKAIKFTQSLITYATDKFYAYPYKDVPRCWRRIYVDASLVQSIARDRLGEYADIVTTIDMALIMAGGEGRKNEIKQVLGWVESTLPKHNLEIPEKFSIVTPTIFPKYPIARVQAPSLESFQKHINESHTPLILTDAISRWKAIKSWNSPEYLLRRTLNGTRLVPIELGESYVSQSWSQKLLPFSTFMQDHLLKQSTPRGYLAQHNLFSQIPSLRKDVAIPDYCFSASSPKSPGRT